MEKEITQDNSIDSTLENVSTDTKTENIETEKPKNTNGGRRDGSGRKLGGTNESTKLRNAAMKEFKSRVAKNASRLFNSQMALAEGTSYLFKITKLTEGEKTSRKAVIVEDPLEIIKYLNHELENPEDYYYITTKAPDNKAIDSLLDRTFGKSQQSIAIEADVNVTNLEHLTDEELTQRIRELTDVIE